MVPRINYLSSVDYIKLRVTTSMGEYKNKYKLIPDSAFEAIVIVQPYQLRSVRLSSMRNQGVDVVSELSGKPVVRSPEGLHVSISHSGEAQIMVFCYHSCGIDVEKRSRVISPSLLRRLDVHSSHALQYWTEIEAYAKLTQTSVFSIVNKNDVPWSPMLTSYSLESSEYAGTLLIDGQVSKVTVVNELSCDITIRSSALIHANVDV